MHRITTLMVLALSTALTRPASAEIDMIKNALGMKFVYIPAGSFRMGTPDTTVVVQEMDEPDAGAFEDESPAHSVTLSRSFLLGQTEVTQKQWLTVMENRPGPVENWQGKDWERLPVVSVSWNMARRFAEELSSLDPDYRYRLPTEAEWEYAARAGGEGVRPMPIEELTDSAWFIANSGDSPHPVATRRPNAWGLHDMLGNVWEWVADWYAPNTYADGAQRTDPVGPAAGPSRVRRGGSYHCPLYQTRPGYREANAPETAYSVIGFRLVAEKQWR